MCGVQLLRVSVHERISAAAEDFLLRLEKGGKAAPVPALRALLTERLAAAAEEIVALLEETVAEYEERAERSEQEICRQRKLLDAVLKPEVRLHTADPRKVIVNKEEHPWEDRSLGLDHNHIKVEEEELSVDPEMADVTAVIVKSEDVAVETEPPQFYHQSRSKDYREDLVRPFWYLGPQKGLGPFREDITEDSDVDKIHEPAVKNQTYFSITSTSIDEKPFSCSDCGQKFSLESNLKKHKIIHTGEKPFSCSECGKCFTQKINLRIHEKIHRGEKPFSCSECGKSFTQKVNLKIHEKIHTGEKPFSCSECGQRFSMESSLKRHKIIHTGEKPFSCSECSKSFNRKVSLRLHERIHTGEKPFGCPECSKRFTQKIHLKIHEKIHIGEKPFSCLG